MAISDKLALLKEMLDSAESNVRSARQILVELAGGDTNFKESYTKQAAGLSQSEEAQIIEGIFDGQSMIGPDEKSYPVPANYASKSKLIPGDVLKLTVTDEGKFLYKQIGPIERRTVIGPLVHTGGQYQVLAEGKAFNVLLASVTYFRASVGDEVTLIIPMGEDSQWGAIEAVLPKFDDDDTEDAPKSKKSKDLLDLEEELDI